MEVQMDAKILLALREGFKTASWNWAVWQDGKQYCGVLQKPLEDVWQRTDDGEYDDILKEDWEASHGS
jgi:hypothetical protein